ncbi:MAG: hypothetical protein CMH81_05445 [Nitrospiraceae bacterium]|nr:hypothetical protein [Nitrospiraceae bacterium]
MNSGAVGIITRCGCMLVITLQLAGCGDIAEHVPNPFELSSDEAVQEKVFVAGSGPSSSDLDQIVGKITVISHGGRDDLEANGPIETALLGDTAIAAGGHAYISNPETGSVTAIFAATDTVEGVVRVGIRPGKVALDPSHQFVFVANQGAVGDARADSVSVIDAVPTTTTFLQEIGRIQVEDSASDITFSTRRDRAFVSNRLSGTISVIDMDPANVSSFLSTTVSIPVGPSPGVMAYSHDSGHVYVILRFPTASDSIAIIDADSLGTPDLLSGIPRGNAADQLPQATFLQASRNGNFIWVSFSVQASSSGGIGVIDTATDTLVSRLDLSFTPNRLVEADDAKLFVSGGEGTDTILVVDASLPTALREVTRIGVGVAGRDRNLAISVDRTRIYVPNVGEVSGSVSVIDVETHLVLATIPTDGENPRAIVSIEAGDLEAPDGDAGSDQDHDHG